MAAALVSRTAIGLRAGVTDMSELVTYALIDMLRIICDFPTIFELHQFVVAAHLN
jgi:hypothetical protein